MNFIVALREPVLSAVSRLNLCVGILCSQRTCIINTIFMFTLTKKMIQTASNRCTFSSTNYEEAVKALNSLQSNASYINETRKLNPTQNNKLEDIKKYLIRSGLSFDQLDRLSVIHVAGTKGKGSTCAFTEAILREYGFCTGLFSSPHLVTVRERFRINGRPIDENEFSRHFWQVYNALYQQKDHENDMPQYFKFLTIMMFHVFIKANVDVAILEVGIGGEKDCTNIVNSTVCTAVTSLGLDHTSLLGDNIESIAFQKSGIFKPGAPAFTVPQPNEAMLVLKRRAIEKKCTLSLAPSLDSYPWRKSTPILAVVPKNKKCPVGIRSSVQKENASLAIQLASTWITRRNSGQNKSVNVLESNENKIDFTSIDAHKTNCLHNTPSKKTSLCFNKVAKALESCKWPGRTQILLGRTIDFYIDGAHTDASIKSCVSWFQGLVKNSRNERSRYLIFNITGDRDATRLQAPLKELGFKKAFFVPNVAGLNDAVDQKNVNKPVNMQLEKCRQNAEIWGESSVLADSVYQALTLIQKDVEINSTDSRYYKPQVLVTGSMYLVGALLCIIDPHLTMTTNY